MDYSPLIDQRRQRLAEVQQTLLAPDFYDDPRKSAQIMREHRNLEQLCTTWDKLQDVRRQIAECEDLAKSEDPDLAEMAQADLPSLTATAERLQQDVQYSLLPPDDMEARDAIIEIRAGTGGDEASLFAGNLLRMYQRYAERSGMKFEHLESSPSDVGGFKEVIIRISGQEVFRHFKYESGVHRVQRVPATETQGRIHTSTATVAVLPEAEEVDIEIRPEDLRIEVCRSGGAGGQHVNRTESAVQIFHLPSGVMVRCEEERSQIKNREKGMKILRAKLFERKQQEEALKYSQHRRSLIGSGGREEKIRTYNFPQSRLTDHRIGFTSHNLDGILDGDIAQLIEQLQLEEMHDRLAEAGLN